jgi:hydroxymethylbilane synthase
MTDLLRIATRQSKLALWQAHYIRDALLAQHNDLKVEIVGFTTEGDRNQHSPLSQIGGKGLFVKELEQALMAGNADIAVHSMKDVPGELPEDLTIAVIGKREDPRDALITRSGLGLADLPKGSRIGSSSLRRRYQIRQQFPEMSYLDLRGNVDTRLRKLESGDYEAIILAASGLRRLGLEQVITETIQHDQCLPAAGQGALGIECRKNDTETQQRIAFLNDEDTWQCVSSERLVTVSLGATCNLPVAAFASIEGDDVLLQAFVSDLDGERVLRKSAHAPRGRWSTLAQDVAAQLISDGADDMISTAV